LEFGLSRTNLAFENKDVAFSDIRGRQSDFSLDKHGFMYIDHESDFRNLPDRDTIISRYIPETENLIKNVLGDLNEIICFDWRVSKRNGHAMHSLPYHLQLH